MEKELATLQLQLKLTSGPKRSALEMLRRKIEVQNEKVVAARRHQQRTKEAAHAAEEVLAAEERIKDQLCQELNLLIQESAHSQLNKLDQLMNRLELLNRDLSVAEVDLHADDQPARSQSVGGVPSSTAAGGAAQGAAGGATAAAPAPPPAAPANQPPAKEQAPPAQQPRAKTEASREAQAARSRHVQMPTSKPARAPPPRQPAPRPPQQGEFHGFDA